MVANRHACCMPAARQASYNEHFMSKQEGWLSSSGRLFSRGPNTVELAFDKFWVDVGSISLRPTLTAGTASLQITLHGLPACLPACVCCMFRTANKQSFDGAVLGQMRARAGLEALSTLSSTGWATWRSCRALLCSPSSTWMLTWRCSAFRPSTTASLQCARLPEGVSLLLEDESEQELLSVYACCKCRFRTSLRVHGWQ